MDTDSDIIHVDSDHDESEDEDAGETSTSGDAVFSAPTQVFIVRALSKAMTGFRPSVMCEGYLAELSKSSSGYILAPLGRDQQLSFKYEPPSPKFSRKRPSLISYRLQLLHGSQFLYSLRGLPKALRCQRSAHALEWGPVHLVFAAAADLDTFLTTLKYVEVEEMAPPGEASAEGGQQQQQQQQQGGGGRGAQPDTAAARQPPAAGAGAGAGTACGGGVAGGRGPELSIGGTDMQWAVAAARLLAAEVAVDAAGPSSGAPAAAEAPAAASPAGGRLRLLDWARSLSPGAPLPRLAAAAAGAAVLAAALAAAAAFLIRAGTATAGRLERRRSA